MSKESQIDRELDRLVDTGQFSYDDARRELGLDAPDNSEFTYDRIKARNDVHDLNVKVYHTPQIRELHQMTPEEKAAFDEYKRIRNLGDTALNGE